jgi:hypothetical protein
MAAADRLCADAEPASRAGAAPVFPQQPSAEGGDRRITHHLQEPGRVGHAHCGAAQRQEDDAHQDDRGRRLQEG